MKWTDAQQKAINGRDGTLLVSAAAGSGKTAVLVERIMQKLCDKENPCKIENLLIVTFTNAAAAQMKTKISKKLDEIISENPDNKELAIQKLTLPYAQICTIDSFCINLVRENFNLLGISPDFEILDDEQKSVISKTALNNTVNKLYQQGESGFLALASMMSKDTDDSELLKLISDVYDKSLALPFPNEWLDSLIEPYEKNEKADESVWGLTIINSLIEALCYYSSKYSQLIDELSQDPALNEKYVPALLEDNSKIQKLTDAVSSLSWDEIGFELNSYESKRFSPVKGDYDEELKAKAVDTRKDFKACINKYKKYFSISEDTHREQIKRLTPAAKALINAVKEYSKELLELKTQENAYYFSDTQHFALELLVKNINGKAVPTELALDISQKYNEILVDEYQDVNEAQDTIFKCISKNETNLFMVGDVKQSIYSFREAMPEIFNKRREQYEIFNGNNYPGTVYLSQNFRSRKGITDIINFIFSPLMSNAVGDVDYNENEYLQYGELYEERNEPDTELHLIECDDKLESQANFTADYIIKQIEAGTLISDGDKKRKVTYKDFCILLRSTTGGKVNVFTSLFDKLNIPYSGEAESSFLTTPEISLIINILKVINNPAQDVPLAAVMLSPAFGFTADELAQMRIEHSEKNTPFYKCVYSFAENGNEKAKAFLEELSAFRKLSVTLPACETARRVIDDKNIKAIASSMSDGKLRVNNINLFLNKIAQYEKSGKNGLQGLLLFIDRLIKSGKDMKGYSGNKDNANAVKIMTIHKSKGLEFPFVFIANCEQNYKNANDNVLIGKNSKLCFREIDNFTKYPTLPHIAARLEIAKSAASEELRILYVALTRAKEKLIILSSDNDFDSALKNCAAKINNDSSISPYIVASQNNYSDLILLSLLRHPDANPLRVKAQCHSKLISCQSKLLTDIHLGYSVSVPEKKIIESIKADNDFLKKISDIVSFKYPFEELNGIVAKHIASDLGEDIKSNEYFAQNVPAFMCEDNLTPAQRGTATHRFMQYMDYSRMFSMKNNKTLSEIIKNEIDLLVNGQMLTPKEGEVINIKNISAFLASPLFSEITSADEVYKEYAFTSQINAFEIYPNLPKEKYSDEKIIIEGVVDCLFIKDNKITIIDYKTDRVTEINTLIDKYRPQLEIYKKCIGEIFNLPVEKTVIYSFALKCFGEIQQNQI